MKICYTIVNPEKKGGIILAYMFTFEKPTLFRRVPVSNNWIPSDSYFDYVNRHPYSSKDTLVSKLIIISFKVNKKYSIYLYNEKSPISVDNFYIESQYLSEFLERFNLV